MNTLRVINSKSRKIICDVCNTEIHQGTNGGGCYGGIVSWLVSPPKIGGYGFMVCHKNRCDLRRDTSQWMELDQAVGPHGLATLVHFMAEPDADRSDIERLLHRLFFTDGKLDPPKLSFDSHFEDMLRIG